MTAVVQPDLGPPAHKYKDNPADDPLRHIGANAHHSHGLQQQHRPTTLVQQQTHKPSDSPHQKSANIPPGAYSTPGGLSGVHLQHPPYPGPAPDPGYYASHPNHYPATTTPAQYPSSGPPDMMATATHMQRPYPPIYHAHTPQSNSPASVSSTQAHDQHGRAIYGQSPQMAPQIYGYQQYSPMNPVHPAYAPHPPTPQHPLTTQPLMIPPQSAPLPHSNPPPPHPAPLNNAAIGNHSPRTNLDSHQQHPPVQAQRPQMPTPNLTSPTGAVPPLSANNAHAQPNHPPSTNSTTNAAPGPIPATTPWVVRQDGNGVQWIAFEYSRDRVKMEYTIRCDVESVNVETLPQEFKTENCVYPRACCSKDEYRGNRLVYETECNAVGWALAQLNTPLRGKRGLIQRAVDSWRNSNQDPRLRSRRVRRMAKMTRRQASQPGHVGAPSPVQHLVSGSNANLAPSTRPSEPMALATPMHHVHSDNSAGNGQVSGGTDLTNGAHHSSIPPGPTPTRNPHERSDLRPGHVFHGLPAYPTAAHASGASGAPAMVPPLRESSGFDAMGRPSVATAASKRRNPTKSEKITDDPDSEDIFGGLPEGKRRKFILVDDTQRSCRVRVKVMLDQVDVSEIPDSYRLTNAVYPRAYSPVQMKVPPSRVVPSNRYRDDSDIDDPDGPVTTGRTLVPAGLGDGDLEVTVPQLNRSRHRKDKVLNDLGYRMSWSQSRVFADRPLFLQRSLDAYRNKMHATITNTGHAPSSKASHFETRCGKNRWRKRDRQDEDNPQLTDSAYRIEAEEVQG